jgi:hypothetical protein
VCRDTDLLHKKKLPERVVVATLLALGGLFIARPGWAAPLEVYGRLPSLENVALSPDGSRIALIHATANDRARLRRKKITISRGSAGECWTAERGSCRR